MNELTNRRGFFRKMAHVLPFLVLTSFPTISMVAGKVMDCNKSCINDCARGCANTCAACLGTCSGTCKGSCHEACKNSCYNFCTGCGAACDGSCTSSNGGMIKKQDASQDSCKCECHKHTKDKIKAE